jgi:type II secretory ATPase GspE/PulE/Tfp pilus assembly ATPase PilB-like protein
MECGHTGYLGRTGVYSYLEVHAEIAEAIHEAAPISEIEHRARAHGYRTLDEVCLELVAGGVTTLDEAEPYLDPGSAPLTALPSSIAE